MLGDSPSRLGNVRWIFLVKLDVFRGCVVFLNRFLAGAGVGWPFRAVFMHSSCSYVVQTRATHAFCVVASVLDVDLRLGAFVLALRASLLFAGPRAEVFVFWSAA